jgi:HEAT repeat protein
MTIQQKLTAVFDADRALRRAEAALLEAAPAEVEATLASAVDEALGLADREEAVMRLVRLADLCAQLPGPRMVDALLAILGDEDEGARAAAGEALLDVGYERYKELALGLERLLASGKRSLALEEAPWIVAEIGETGALKLLARFLEHADAEVCASTIEALVSLGDPEAARLLRPLVGDTREVVVEDADEESSVRTTVGELATEALEALGAEDA